MDSPFKNIFDPLYGSKPSKPVKAPTAAKARAAPKRPIPPPQPRPQLQPPPPNTPKSMAPIKASGLEGFVKDNKTLLLIAVVIIILVVVGYLAYKQKKQTKAILRLAKKFKRLK